ncbi:hypothetical protein M1E11_16725 [Bacillus sp. JZ8]
MASKEAVRVELVSGGNVIKQGDETTLVFQFRDETGEIMDIQGSTVTIKLANSRAVILEKTAEINTNNTISLEFTSNDVTGWGIMRIEFKIIFSDGTIRKFPQDDWYKLNITRTLDDLALGKITYITLENFTAEVNAATEQAETQALYAKNQGDYAKQQGEAVAGEISKVKDKIEEITAIISDYPRLATETNDTGRFTRAISYLSSKNGGSLKLKSEIYELDSFEIPDNITIEGQDNKDPWNKTASTLKFNGSGTFITISSYHNKRATLKNVNIIHATPSRTNTSKAILIKLNTNLWGAGADIEKVTVFGFGTGILHQMTYQNYLNNCQIWECGTGIAYNAKVEGSTQNATASFGNVNIVERTNVIQSNIGVELASDTLNNFKNCNFEKCYVGVYTHALSGGFNKPQQHTFENCWFERNGWASDADYTNNTNPRYLICNSDMDSNFNALGTNVADIPKFINCRDNFNVSPEIPSHNTNYKIFTILDERITKRYTTDDPILSLYKLPSYLLKRVTVGKNNAWRDIFTIGNKGVVSKLNFNGYEYRTDTPASGSVTYQIDYSSIVNADFSGTQNITSSVAVASVYARRTGYGTYNSIFLLNDVDENSKVFAVKVGEDNSASILSNCTITTSLTGNVKTLTVNITGVTDTVIVKINYLPNGLMRGAGASS